VSGRGRDEREKRAVSEGKHSVVVADGSFGGGSAAHLLRRKIRDRAEMTLVSAGRDFTVIPGLPWVMMGWRRPEDHKAPVAGTLAKRWGGACHSLKVASERCRIEKMEWDLPTAHFGW
jgi:hypothetical protein